MEKFNFKKSLGQNFLTDKNIVNKIVNSIDTKENDLIIEIGPGNGSLTKKLKEKNCNILCFEIDLRLKEYLKELEDEKTKIIYTDFLKIDLEKIINQKDYNNIYFVANLPYYITTPIINKITESKLNIKSLVFMVQKEVGDRFLAKPHSKKYSSLTVYLNYFYEIKKVVNVGKKCFYPIPNVDSIVLKFNKKERLNKPKNEELFFKVVKDSFKLKRKTLKNNLKNYPIENMFKDLKLKETVRAEELSLEDFIKISDYLS